jgi:hypothetical protein
MKYLLYFSLIFSIFLISCGNSLNNKLAPDLAKAAAQVQKDRLDPILTPEAIGVNFLYRYGFAIYSYSKHGILTEKDVHKFCDAADQTLLPAPRKGYYSVPQGRTYTFDNSDRVMTRDDYLGLLLGMYFAAKIDDCAKGHLNYLVEVMEDNDEPPIPPRLDESDKPNDAQGRIFDDLFVGDIISFYKDNILEGLELGNDVWSPYHKQIFQRALKRDKNYRFWDMVGFYAEYRVVAASGDISKKLLSSVGYILAREHGSNYWTVESDNYIHNKVDFNQTLDAYYGADYPLAKLLKGLL